MRRKILPTFKIEKSLWKRGFFVIGVDEVGRGALAGPLYVGAVVFNFNKARYRVSRFEELPSKLIVPIKSGSKQVSSLYVITKISSGGKVPFFTLTESEEIERLGINDSKKLSPIKREKLAKIIKNTCFAYATASVSNKVIDKVGITKATQIAMRKAINKLRDKSYELRGKKLFILVDAFYVKFLKGIGLKNQKAIIKGDEKSISIAAASIIAKVERDQNMIKLDQEYPIYFWKNNKGYGTRNHIEAIKKFGKSKLHRDLFLRKIL